MGDRQRWSDQFIYYYYVPPATTLIICSWSYVSMRCICQWHQGIAPKCSEHISSRISPAVIVFKLLYSNYWILDWKQFTDDTNLWFRFTLGSIFNNWCISCRHWTDFLLTLIAGDRTDYTVNSGDVVEAIESFGQSRRWSFFICLIKTIINNTYINVLTGYYNFYRAYPVGYSTLTFAISSLIYHKF